MVPGTMSSLAVASTVSRSAAGSKGLRFVSDAAVPPKEHATATASAKIRVVMISLLGHADELTVGPPTSGYGTSGNIETSASGDSSPTGTHAGQAAPFWVEPFRLTPRGRTLQKKAMSGGFKMKRSAAIRSAVRSAILLGVRSAILLSVLAAGGVSAQQASTDEHLTATQKLGRQVFAQSCGICHLPPQINARTYGPLLSKDTA